ncbi:Hypothetical predicted protein [Paramuricea clavata]|uniref:Uncharacterized protein n=1 Tax=Paramuricea clavata TaxID=317549 RepID=A0A6S7IUT3_PARCT|nr:Hypothetical predicted protein [Paramuricea clavata]
MELESLKRQLSYLENANVEVKKLVTDRHVQVSAYMASEKSSIEHNYDVWHVAKGVKKKLLKASKTKKFKEIKLWIGSIVNHVYWVAISTTNEKEREEKWRSLLNHIMDVHVHEENKIFQRCTHGELDRAWIKAGSAAHKKLKEILTKPRLISAIRKLSNLHQTSSLESKHSLDNQFASKNVYYPYHSLMARLFCANMHFNENSKTKQAKTKKESDRWVIIYPKAHKGEKAIAKKIKEAPTFSYVKRHQSESLKLRQKFPTLKKARLNAIDVLPKEPPSLVDQYKKNNPPESKNSIIAKRFSRFTKPAYPVEDNDICECSGKCATKRCGCKASKRLCSSSCSCTREKCLNK